MSIDNKNQPQPQKSLSGETASEGSLNLPPPTRRFNQKLAAVIRWLHIYLSMFSFTALLFFGITGLTLNHPDWLFGTFETRSDAHGQINPQWLQRENPGESESDRTEPVSRLEIVEHLRREHRIHGAVEEFRVDDAECFVFFKGPGYSADAFINRGSGSYTLTQSHLGLIAVLNDLHKGRHTGLAWSVLIDVSAILTSLICVTGLALIFYIKRRRVAGLLTTLVGTMTLLAVLIWLVP